jgi:hypothetical protein
VETKGERGKGISIESWTWTGESGRGVCGLRSRFTLPPSGGLFEGSCAWRDSPQSTGKEYRQGVQPHS